MIELMWYDRLKYVIAWRSGDLECVLHILAQVLSLPCEVKAPYRSSSSILYCAMAPNDRQFAPAKLSAAKLNSRSEKFTDWTSLEGANRKEGFMSSPLGS